MTVKYKLFSGIDAIVKEPLKFKAKLAIGEDAYKSLRIKKAAWEIWDVTNAAASPAKFAAIASTYFGFSATPVGWVVLAGVVLGGGYLGITRYLKNSGQDKVDVIPKFINTPLDVLALGLFDLIAPLALKVANVDGRIDITEKQAISSYFVKEWGYDQRFIEEGIDFTESKLAEYTIKDLAQILAEFQKQSPDCNFKLMSKEIVNFLRMVIESDGKIDEREEMAIEKVKMVFDEVDQINFRQMAKNGYEAVSDTVIDSGRTIKTKSGEILEKTGELTSGACNVIKEKGGKAADFVSESCGSAMAQGIKIVGNLKSKVTTAVKNK